MQRLNSPVFRTVAYVNGLFCLYLSIAMLAPMAVDYFDGNTDWRGFLVSALLTGTLSGATVLASRGNFPRFTPRVGFLLVATLWLFSTLVASLPIMLGSAGMSFTDAVFEAMSGLTTTGATVITGLDDKPRGLLVWRSLTQWIGGLGIVAVGLLLLPYLKIGGMQFFRMESSERGDKPVARLETFAIWLVSIYVSLTLACAVLYASFGMSWFDAINHAMTTVATSGFSTHDTSFAQYGNGVLVVSMVFMLIAAMPFAVFFISLFSGTLRESFDEQIPVLTGVVFLLTVPVYLGALAGGSLAPLDALTHAAFNVVSIVTTTGYASADYTLWGPATVAAVLLATFLGGCTGSTSGGIKTYRLIILFRTVSTGVRNLVYPNGVFPVHYNGRRVGDDTVRAVAAFFFAFMAILLICTIAVAATGLDLVTAFSGSLASVSNVGPALGNIIGPAGNYSSLPDAAKWVLTLAMFLGRLEIMTILVVASPFFWRSV
jgi:trk system potassium uptake protein TrkH